MLDGMHKQDPPTVKKFPVEADVPEFLSSVGQLDQANDLDKAIGDLALIAFYYLLRVGEYTIKGARNNTKQTVQFWIKDVTFFGKDNGGTLRQLSRTSPLETLLNADSATLKLDNRKNGWKGVCVHQHANGERVHCPVKALAWRVAHIRHRTRLEDTYLSAFFSNNTRFDVTDTDIRTSIKMAATILGYPRNKGIPIDRIAMQLGCKCTVARGFPRQRNTKNGALAKRTRLFLRRDVQTDEAAVQFCQYRWRCISRRDAHGHRN